MPMKNFKMVKHPIKIKKGNKVNKNIFLFFLLSLVLLNVKFSVAQEEDWFEGDTTETVEVYLIDNYVKNENGKILVLSWMTNIPCKSKVEILGLGTFIVSDSLTDFHQSQINLSSFDIKNAEIHFVILSQTEEGKVFTSEEYSFSIELPATDSIQHAQFQRTSYFMNFLIGLGLWLLPYPAFAIENENFNLAIHKELPLLGFGFSSAYRTYPWFYFHVGYLHIFNGKLKNSFRMGVKGILEIKPINRIITFGTGGFTNFYGKNGLSIDAGLSLLKVLRTFDFTINYSYNFIPNDSYKLHLFTLSFFTSAFSININK